MNINTLKKSVMIESRNRIMQSKKAPVREPCRPQGTQTIGFHSLRTNRPIDPKVGDMMLKHGVETGRSRREEEWSDRPKKKITRSPLVRSIFVCGNGEE